MKLFLILGICSLSWTSGSHYSDLQNRGLEGRVREITQLTYRGLDFVKTRWALDSNKVQRRNIFRFDTFGNMRSASLNYFDGMKWYSVETKYIYDTMRRLVSTVARDSKGKELENTSYSWPTKYSYQSNTVLPAYKYINESVNLNKMYRPIKTIRKHYHKDQLTREEWIMDTYNAQNDGMMTTHKISQYSQDQAVSQDQSFGYKIYEKDNMLNWLEMAAIEQSTKKLFFYMKRSIEYY